MVKKLSRRDFLKIAASTTIGSLFELPPVRTIRLFEKLEIPRVYADDTSAQRKHSPLDIATFRKNSVKTFKEAYDVASRNDAVIENFKDMILTLPEYFVPSAKGEILPEDIDVVKTGLEYLQESFIKLEEANKAEVFMALDGALKNPHRDKNPVIENLENSGHLNPIATQYGIYPYQELKKLEKLMDEEIKFIENSDYENLKRIYNQEKEELIHLEYLLEFTEILGEEKRFSVFEIFKEWKINFLGIKFSIPIPTFKRYYPIRDLSKTALDYVRLDKKHVDLRLEGKKRIPEKKPDFLYKDIKDIPEDARVEGNIEVDKDLVIFGQSAQIKTKFVYVGKGKLYGSPEISLMYLEPPYWIYSWHLTKNGEIVKKTGGYAPEYWWIEPGDKFDLYLLWTYNDEKILSGDYRVMGTINIPVESTVEQPNLRGVSISGPEKTIKLSK